MTFSVMEFSSHPAFPQSLNSSVALLQCIDEYREGHPEPASGAQQLDLNLSV